MDNLELVRKVQQAWNRAYEVYSMLQGVLDDADPDDLLLGKYEWEEAAVWRLNRAMNDLETAEYQIRRMDEDGAATVQG